METESGAKTRWSLAFAHHDKDYKPHSNDDIAGLLRKGIREPKRTDFKSEQSYKWRLAEVKLLTSNLPDLISLFGDDLRLVGNHAAEFVSVYSDIPVGFANFQDSPALLVTTVAVDKTFDTSRSTAKDRAAEMVTLLLPSIRKMAERFTGPEINFFGMSVVYGSKDFAVPDAFPEPEFVAIIVSKTSSDQFARGEMTDDELLEEAAIFLSDRDMSDVKRTTPKAK